MELFEFFLIPGAEIDAVYYDLPGLRPRQTDNLTEKRTLAGPASSEQDHCFSPRDFQVDAVQYAAVVVTNDQVTNGNGRFWHRSLASREIENGRKGDVRKDDKKRRFHDSGGRGSANGVRAAANPEPFKTADVHNDGRECKTL
jgi:hypothetical protein